MHLAPTLALACLLAIPASAAAQSSARDPLARQRDLDGAHSLRDAGIGMTLAGITTTAAATAFLFTLDFDWGISEGVFMGLGSLLALIGIPTWIAGAVRSGELREPDVGDGPRVTSVSPWADPWSGGLAISGTF